MDEVGEPRRINSSGLAAVWEMEAFGTRYRGVVVPVGGAFDADIVVAVEPAGGRLNLNPARMWHTFRRVYSPLHQNYIEEKFAVKGEDAVALTLLIGKMLDREAVIHTPDAGLAEV